MNASNPSQANSEPSPAAAAASTRSLSQQPATWQSLTMLSPSEMESLRQRSKQADVEIKEYLAFLKVNKQQTVA